MTCWPNSGCRSWLPTPTARWPAYAYAAPWRQKPAYRHTVEDSIFVAPGMAGREPDANCLDDCYWRRRRPEPGK